MTAEPPAAATDQRIARVTLDSASLAWRGPEAAHERSVAIYDLVEANRFAPAGCAGGPYHLLLRLEDNRLIFDIRDLADRPQCAVGLPLVPFRRLIRDYFTICDSYYEAIRNAPPSRIEVIDMGRRGLHDEGSNLLRERLKDSIALDHDTARRLFTLLCALYHRG